MTLFELFIAFVACLGAGAVSAIMGLGGGLILVPLLTLVPSITLDAARGVSLLCTLATSAAGSVALDKAKLAEFDLVLILELAAAVGALVGAALLEPLLPKPLVFLTFAALVSLAAYRMIRGSKPKEPVPPPTPLGDPVDAEAEASESGSVEAPAAEAPAQPAAPEYPVNLGLGAAGFVLSGIASAVLGIGGSPIKVPVQTEICRIPLRIALANSNLMVGITAGVGAAVYLGRGTMALALVAPCALGMSIGAYIGGRLAPKIPVQRLRGAFALLLVIVAGRMLWKAL